LRAERNYQDNKEEEKTLSIFKRKKNEF